MIIGITGTDGAGKGTVVEYLIQKGFTHYSARDLWVEEIKRHGLEINRANMRLMANKLRKKHGNDFLITEYLERKRRDQKDNVIIESIRTMAEAHTLKKAGGVLLAVDANPKIRYQRVQERASESDKVTFEEFMSQEELEMRDPDPNGMQKAEVIAAADYTLYNNGTREKLFLAVEEVLKKISQ